MQGFWLRSLFCQKATKSESLLSSFSFKFYSLLNPSRWAEANHNHGGSNYIFLNTTFSQLLIFNFLLHVAKRTSSLNSREMRTVRTEFLTLQGINLSTRHMRHHEGLTCIWQPFPLISRTFITAPASECRAPTVPGTTPCHGCKALPFVLPCYSTGGWISVKAKVPQVLGLLLYHISRHVTSTFNACHSTTTPFDLSIFILHRRGINQPWISHKAPPVDLMIPT